MNTSAAASSKAPNEFPLTFKQHNFEAHCYNTLKCRVIYNNFNFTGLEADSPSGPPSGPDYRERWSFASYVGVRNFPPPAEVQWTSLDGVEHEAKVDIGNIFKDELVLHKVPESDYAERSFGGSPSIFIEVNDRTINVYMKAAVATKTEQIPGNKYSFSRTDLILAWSKTY
jgi:hypothetical protein